MYVVEKGIPIPKNGGVSAGETKYHWERLELGDSYWFGPEEAPKGNLNKLRQRVYNAARMYGLKTNKKFLALIVEEERGPEDGEKILVRGVRCWYEADVPTAAAAV